MTIDPKPDQAQVIDAAIRAGLIQSPDDALDIGVNTLRGRLERKSPARPSAAEAKARAFEQWARSHPHTPALPDEALRRENLVRTP